MFHLSGTTLHELLFGTLLANIITVLGILRFIYRLSRKYKKRVQFFFEKIDIMWFEYGATRYPGLSQLEIYNKLNKELDDYANRTEQ